MVLGIITSIAACPAIIGTTEAVRHGQKSNARESHRGRKSNLVAHCSAASCASKGSDEVNGGIVVLGNNKVDHNDQIAIHPVILLTGGLQLYVRTPGPEGPDERATHPFEGYFLPYPNTDWGRRGEGLVSTINADRQLNWIYVDEETCEVKYGNRVESEEHLTGPWDCTKIERRMTLEGWEGFMAVKEKPRVWALYFDVNDDGLRDKVLGKRILEVELTRKERRWRKDDEEEGRVS